MVSRRDFLKLGPAFITGGLLLGNPSIGEPAVRETSYRGKNLAGWVTDLGDAIYARAGDPPVSLSDIETTHAADYSELHANTQPRAVMAHNITYKKIIHPKARSFIHSCAFGFRLPYVPAPDTGASENAQTLEGGFFVWDGARTRLDYGIAFQWILNPWMTDFGSVKTWTDTDANVGEWLDTGDRLTPDTQWHRVQMVVDFGRETTALVIDGKHYLSYLTKTTKPANWGTEIAARLQAEIVSIYPEPSGLTATHRAQFRDWEWIWRP